MYRWIWGALLCCVAFSVQAMDKTQAADWSDDLDALHQGLRSGHIDLYHQISEPEFRSVLAAIKTELEQLSPIEAEMRVWRALHMVGGGTSDGHTSVLLDFKRYQWLPVRFAIYGEDVRVVGSTDQHKSLRGLRLVRIGKTPISQALHQLREIAQFTENAQSERFFLTSILRCAEVLHGLGFSSDAQSISMALQNDKGKTRTVSLRADSYAISRDIVDGYPRVVQALTKPESTFSPTLWFTNLENASAVYIKFDRYPKLEAMEAFGQQLAASIQNSKTRNVIIDLRTNFGGNGFIGHRLAAAILDENAINWRNGVYVLTGAQTFSAATMNAVEYRQILNARLVGEPTGGNPVGYQDSDRFRLPNSGLIISFSKRLYRMQDVPTQGVQPDVFMPERWSDRRIGRDAALEWVVNDISLRSVTE